MTAIAGPVGIGIGSGGGGGGGGRCLCFAARGNGALCGRPSARRGAPRAACCTHAAQLRDGNPNAEIVFNWAPSKLESTHDVYVMCAGYWDRDDPCGSKNGVAELSNVLMHLFNAEGISRMALEWGVGSKWISAKVTKERLARWIVRIARDVWSLSARPGALTALCRLQRRWRAGRARRATEGLRGPYPTSPAVNDSDPFTLDALCEIPADQLFSFRDLRGGVYAFRAAELAHYLAESAPEAVNPYNREPICKSDLARLRKLMELGAAAGASAPGSSRLTNLDELWSTGRDAFSYTLYFFEREGFYCDVDAFVQLSADDIANVFAFFGEATRGSSAAVGLMREGAWVDAYDGSAEGRLRRMQFAFCKEMLSLVRPPRERKFYLLCNLFICVAAVSAAVSRSLPEWARSGAGLADMPRAIRNARAVHDRAYTDMLGRNYRVGE